MIGDVVNGFVGMLESHATSLGNIASILLVFGGEALIGDNVFDCPCLADDLQALEDPFTYSSPVDRKYYGACFIVWPAVAVFCLSLALNGQTKRCLALPSRHCYCRRHARSFGYLVSNSITALVPPSAWLILTFIDGRYLECVLAKIPSNCLEYIPFPNDTTAQANLLFIIADNGRHRSLSQILAWSLLGGGILLASLVILCSQFCSNVSYYHKAFMDMFRKKEMEAFHTVTEEILTEEMQEKWKLFFHQATLEDWDRISSLPFGGPRVINNKLFYSAFHAWQPRKRPEEEETLEMLMAGRLKTQTTNPSGEEMEKADDQGNSSEGNEGELSSTRKGTTVVTTGMELNAPNEIRVVEPGREPVIVDMRGLEENVATGRKEGVNPYIGKQSFNERNVQGFQTFVNTGGNPPPYNVEHKEATYIQERKMNNELMAAIKNLTDAVAELKAYPPAKTKLPLTEGHPENNYSRYSLTGTENRKQAHTKTSVHTITLDETNTRQLPISTPMPMSDDPDDKLPIVTMPKKYTKKTKKKKVKKSQVVDAENVSEDEA